jgi:Tfp pilus assembly protein PilF
MGKKSATQTIEKAISLKPNYRDAYLGLATILIQNKEIPEAKIWLERAAKYYPNDKEIEDKLSQL